ncbi:MAG: hypothetical protein KJS68_16695 [Alphaproteobacteria bacterium]|nr:hypothetical protein [Alphaproteobacteria bacterium]MDE2493557.1 hypothetical protein [Alphaproteobacteria bacterium]
MGFAVAQLRVTPAFADENALNYRGFTVNTSIIGGADNTAAVLESLRHQIDIVADCGMKPDILTFFRNRHITLRHIKGDEPGCFAVGKGVMIDAEPQSTEKPILLHEFLHAYHFLAMPEGIENPDVLHYYRIAKNDHLYRMEKPGDLYLLKNPKEFFAVTGSCYLWGTVDRQPYTRERLKEKQPYYTAWLGRLFGVEK